MFTQPKLFVDDGLLRGFLVEERARKSGLLDRIAKDKGLVMSGDRFAYALKALGVDPPTKTSPKTKKQIWAFAKNDVGMQELLEHEDDEVRWLAEARIAHKSTINETRAERFLRMGQGGRTLPVYLRYAAAHTFRWGGSDKTNLQNLQRTNKKDPKRGVLRKSLLSPLGHKVLSADSGAIEARVVAWLAGHDELVEAFRLNRDIYSEFASEIWGRKVDRKKNPEDEIPGFVAKICVLGLSYSMGWHKLADSFLKGAMNGPPVQFGWAEAQQMGVDLNKWYQDERKVERVRSMVSRLPTEELQVHCAVTDAIVKKYRKINKPIVDFWHTMEQVLEAMCEDEADYSFGPNECLRVVRHGIILPNGLTLKYPGLKYSAEDSLGGEEGFSYLGQYGKQRQRMYGGAAVENLTQAIARCIVAEQLLHMRAVTGYSPCLFAHDELSYVVPDRDADALLNILKETMRTPPSWAAGLPLSVEGGYANSYGAAK
jgi:DNA polymerase